MVAARAPQREEFLATVLVAVRERLAAAGIEAEVTGRPKHLWSIYEKMVVRGKEFDDIHDLLGIRVIVSTEKDCWAALGAIHAIWPPVQGRFKDYINTPKFNLYQSLHTTVIGLDGKPIEVQVRTHEMHSRAEYGIAAHWGYKEKGDVSSEMAWMQRIADVDRETTTRSSSSRPSSSTWSRTRSTSSPPRAGSSPCRPAPPRSTSPTPSTPRWATVASGPGSTAAWSRSTPGWSRPTPSRSSPPRRYSRPVARLAPDRGLLPGPQQDPPVVLPGAPGGRHRGRPRGAGQGRCAVRASPSTRCWPRRPWARWPRT